MCGLSEQSVELFRGSGVVESFYLGPRPKKYLSSNSRTVKKCRDMCFHSLSKTCFLEMSTFRSNILISFEPSTMLVLMVSVFVQKTFKLFDFQNDFWTLSELLLVTNFFVVNILLAKRMSWINGIQKSYVCFYVKVKNHVSISLNEAVRPRTNG